MHKRAEEFAEKLWDAQTSGIAIDRLTDAASDLTLEQAYGIQGLNRTRREGDGAKVIGYKIGITSDAVMAWLEVDQPDFGVLFDDMVTPDGGTIVTDSLLQPRIEAELAFVLGADLKGPGITAADVVRATSSVMPCLEIVDSRVKDWKIKIEDTVADNASSARLVLGGATAALSDIDLELFGMALKKNGRVVSSGAGAACLGNPINAVVWLANTLGRLGTPLLAGQVVLSGALGPVVEVNTGDFFEASLSKIGRARVRFE